MTDLVLYPCSLIDNKCYECEPSLRTEGKCLSCTPGYKYNNITNFCEECKGNEFPIIVGDFDNCQYPFVDSYCDLYTTYCNHSENEEIICPDKAPIYDTITKSCHEFDCQNKGLENGICLISKKKYKDRIITVNWFISDYNYNQYPSYNVDNSGYLIIGLSTSYFYTSNKFSIGLNSIRILFCYDKEGRGLFNEINDTHKKYFEFDKNVIRFISTSILIRANNSEEYRYLLNLDSYSFNLEFFDLKTEYIGMDDIFIALSQSICKGLETNLRHPMSFLELNEKNNYLVVFYASCVNSVKVLFFIIFSLDPFKKKKVNIYSLNSIKTQGLSNNFDYYSRICAIQTKRGDIIFSFLNKEHFLGIWDYTNGGFQYFNYLFEDAFHKLLFIKDEINLICYYPKLFPSLKF